MYADRLFSCVTCGPCTMFAVLPWPAYCEEERRDKRPETENQVTARRKPTSNRVTKNTRSQANHRSKAKLPDMAETLGQMMTKSAVRQQGWKVKDAVITQRDCKRHTRENQQRDCKRHTRENQQNRSSRSLHPIAQNT